MLKKDVLFHMAKRKDYSATELNRRDRKVLDKYTKFYTNFIESNTATSDSMEEQTFKNRE
jgi:hypothetical protein